MIDKKLLDLIACPSCKSGLVLAASGEELVCRAERLAFPVRSDVPVLLESEARTMTSDELASVTTPPSRIHE